MQATSAAPARIWPGIATTRIQSSDDPGRPASEIINQIGLSRKIGRNWVGHIHWSTKGLMTNQGGISTALAGTYTQPFAVPPMPWISKSAPAQPKVGASATGAETRIRWTPPAGVSKIAIQARYGGAWRTVAIVPAGAGAVSLAKSDAIAVSSLDRYGNSSQPKVLGIR